MIAHKRRKRETKSLRVERPVGCVFWGGQIEGRVATSRDSNGKDLKTSRTKKQKKLAVCPHHEIRKLGETGR